MVAFFCIFPEGAFFPCRLNFLKFLSFFVAKILVFFFFFFRKKRKNVTGAEIFLNHFELPFLSRTLFFPCRLNVLHFFAFSGFFVAKSPITVDIPTEMKKLHPDGKRTVYEKPLCAIFF